MPSLSLSLVQQEDSHGRLNPISAHTVLDVHLVLDNTARRPRSVQALEKGHPCRKA